MSQPDVASVLTKIISQVYVENTQQIDQNLGSVQNINQICAMDISSSSPASYQSFITDCYNTIKDKKKDKENPFIISDTFKEICTPLNCGDISGVNMEQKININLTNINNSQNSQTIVNMVKNSLQQNSDLQASNLNINIDNAQDIDNNITDIFSNMSTTIFQKQIVNLALKQNISVKGGAILENVSVSDTLNLIENAILSSETTQDQINQLTKTILQSSEVIAEAGIAELLEWVIRIVLLIITVVILFFVINIAFEVFILLA